MLATFAVNLVTVLVQGATLETLIRRLRFDRGTEPPGVTLAEDEARLYAVAAQISAVEAASLTAKGEHRHPRLIEQLRFRHAAIKRSVEADDALADMRTDHFGVQIDGIAAGAQGADPPVQGAARRHRRAASLGEGAGRRRDPGPPSAGTRGWLKSWRCDPFPPIAVSSPTSSRDRRGCPPNHPRGPGRTVRTRQMAWIDRGPRGSSPRLRLP